jgi:hypothetical protein
MNTNLHVSAEGHSGAAGRLEGMRRLPRYLWGVVARPRATFDELAGQSSIRPAVALVVPALLQGWLNMLLFAAFGYDWLSTRRELLAPTYVGLFGRLRLGRDQWVPIFAALDPLLGLLGLVVVPGLAHVLSKLWGGQAIFEQMINALTFAIGVPGLLLRSLVELLTGVPMNLISRHPYWFTAATPSLPQGLRACAVQVWPASSGRWSRQFGALM